MPKKLLPNVINDEVLFQMWEEFGDTPVTADGNRIVSSFYVWKCGHHKEDIWHWFDAHHSKGVAWLMGVTSEGDHIND